MGSGHFKAGATVSRRIRPDAKAIPTSSIRIISSGSIDGPHEVAGENVPLRG
ncbi:hypothetical protein C7450_12270 [Chelatococcus asaccharovorans]|uniref:Uncharacterized protein n=1 Tax=Chelatococcus asaccharovorans TaxID=28210 RepID=A0A2V3U288_9HYPH|nr:hypothetical protein C7450_12270 [Chelatococcus asaccharovorans]